LSFERGITIFRENVFKLKPNQHPTRLRDTLLPKLMSGEVRIMAEIQEAVINAK
jgi:hypothetical protein